MANTFALNTAQHPNLKQVLIATPEGVFDFLAQKAGSTVVVPVAERNKLAQLRDFKHPNGNPYLVES